MDDPNKSGFDREPIVEEPKRVGCWFWLGLLIAGCTFWYVVIKLVYAWWHR